MRNSTYILKYLQDHPCVDCGERDTVVLEFDHVSGEKKWIVARMVGHDIKTIELEIEKCEVRCANCHAIATARRKGAFRYRMTRPSE